MHELGTVFYVIKQVEQLCVENNLYGRQRYA